MSLRDVGTAYSPEVPERRQWWPVRLHWRRGGSRRLFARHFIEIGWDWQIDLSHSPGCMPGYRAVLKQVFHVGALKIVLGRDEVEPLRRAHVGPKA